MKLISSIVIVFALFTSCKEKSEYSGFSVTETGLNYKIHTIGEPKKQLMDSHMIWLNYEVTDLNDSIIQTSMDTHVLFRNDVTDTNIQEFLNFLVIGDSASMIMEDDLNKLKSKSVNVLIKGQASINEWRFYSSYAGFFEFNEIKSKEANDLQSILNKYQGDSIEVYNGVFIVQEVVGIGDCPATNDVAIFHFEGLTMEGKLFDSTRKRKEMFSYQLGEQDQVIKGLDFAIRRMKKGEKATVIIPSFLGFGSTGSSNGLVAPNQPLIYKIELVDISQSKE